jgi:hypothetical protein
MVFEPILGFRGFFARAIIIDRTSRFEKPGRMTALDGERNKTAPPPRGGQIRYDFLQKNQTVLSEGKASGYFFEKK